MDRSVSSSPCERTLSLPVCTCVIIVVGGDKMSPEIHSVHCGIDIVRIILPVLSKCLINGAFVSAAPEPLPFDLVTVVLGNGFWLKLWSGLNVSIEVIQSNALYLCSAFYNQGLQKCGRENEKPNTLHKQKKHRN